MVSNVGSDVNTLKALLKDATGPLLQNAISDSYIPIPNDTSNSWIKLFQKVNKEKNDNVSFDGNVEYGMALAYTTVQVLKEAGKELTRGKLIAAVEKNGLSGPGLVPFRYSKSDHSGYGGTQVVKIVNGVPKSQGPIYTTDDSDAPIKKYTTAQPAAPTDGLPQ